jgi:DNA polymerase III delta subunit
VEPRVFLLYGADTYRVHKAVRALVERLLPQAGGVEGLNTQRLDGERLTPEALRAACWAPPFLAPLRLVVVRGLLERWAGERRRRGDSAEGGLQAWQEALRNLAHLPLFTRLIFWEGPLPPDHTLLQTLRGLEPLVQVQAMERPTHADMARLLEEEARGRGLTLTPEALHSLVERTWPDLWRATGALDKLALLFPRDPITPEEVAMVEREGEASVFHLLDALFTGDAGRALALLRALLGKGVSAGEVLALLGREVRSLAVAREMLSEGTPLSTIQEALNLPPARARQVAQRAGRVSADGLALLYERLVQADLAIKQGLHGEETALTLLVAGWVVGRG